LLAWIKRHSVALGVIGAVIAAAGGAFSPVLTEVKEYYAIRAVARTTLTDSAAHAERILFQDCRLVANIESHLKKLVPPVKVVQLQDIRKKLDGLSEVATTWGSARKEELKAWDFDEALTAKRGIDKLMKSVDMSSGAVQLALAAFPDTGNSAQEWLKETLTEEMIVEQLDIASGMAVAALKWSAETASLKTTDACAQVEFAQLVPGALMRFDMTLKAAGFEWEELKDIPTLGSKVVYYAHNELAGNKTPDTESLVDARAKLGIARREAIGAVP
jgi:hypothetical protein